VTLLNGLAIIVACLLAVPCLVFSAECIVALLPGGRGASPAPPSAPRPRAVVIVPAHDEQAGIAATVAALAPLLGADDRMLVVADNCSDQTAAAARAAGAEVIERHDSTQRGKGFAIVFALDHLAAAPPDVVIVVDADCRLSADGLAILAREAAANNRPVQGEYVLATPERPTPRGVLSALAVLVRNRVRPLGLRRLGLPSQLTGSGMAFPWSVLRAAPHPGANLVEDLVMGLELALAGHAPLMCPSVRVSSELPEGDSAALGQRRRWEHGQLATLLRYAPRLIGRGLIRGRADLLALGLDLCVPPLALLVTIVGAAVLGTFALAMLTGGSKVPVTLSLLAFSGLAISVLGAWIKFGGAEFPLRYIFMVPLYVLWKIPLYLAFIVRGKHKSWDRTQRKGEARRPDERPPVI
jgi:cellulose synthase/poly-beta-1,6-N-acetylglucosamine synthase-like glycosyltransferase